MCFKLILIGSGRHFHYITYVMALSTIEYSEILDFGAHIVYTTTLLLCRMSGLALYYRICRVHSGLLLLIRIIFGILIAGYLPQLLLIVFHCTPVTGLWPYPWQSGYDDHACLQWGLVYSVNSAVSLLCDLLLFGIPVVMLKVLEMPRRRKIQMACILLPGVSVVGISVARLVLVVLGQWQPDQSWTYNPMLGVEVAEIGATLIALSVPGVMPLVDKVVVRWKREGRYYYRGGETESRRTRKKKKKKRISSHDTPLQSLSLRHRSQEESQGSNEVFGGGGGTSADDECSENSADGILVKVDFQVRESHADESEGSFGGEQRT